MQAENVNDVATRRQELGISQLELAVAADVSLMTLRNVERGIKVRSKSRRKVLEALDRKEREKDYGQTRRNTD